MPRRGTTSVDRKDPAHFGQLFRAYPSGSTGALGPFFRKLPGDTRCRGRIDAGIMVAEILASRQSSSLVGEAGWLTIHNAPLLGGVDHLRPIDLGKETVHHRFRKGRKMSFRGHVTGAIANPVLRWTGQQRAVLEVRIHATAAAKDRESGQWQDVGDPLWISASFWDQEAQTLADLLGQGDRVTVEGTLVLESYQRRDGSPGVSYSLRSPRFLGVIPSRRSQQERAKGAEADTATGDGYAPF